MIDIDEIIAEVRGPDTPAPNLPTTFWDTRPELAAIRDTAHARTRSADAVLGAVLARVATCIHPTVTLPPIVGARGSLDYIAALVAPSGAGKSSSTAIAAELIDVSDDRTSVITHGSGEGLIDSYLGMVQEHDDDGKPVKVRRQVKDAVLVEIDEGQVLAELGSRKGSTLGPTLRSAWSGATLGTANADAERRRHIPGGSYRFAAIVGLQTAKAAAVLDDADGGTAQRFVWFSATDPNIPDNPPTKPAWSWERTIHDWMTFKVDESVATEIRARDLARSRGEVTPDPLDGHRDLARLKTAALLAMLNRSKVEVTAQDWDLAGQVMDASDRVRQTIIDHAQWVAKDAARRDTDRHLARAQALDDDAADRALRRVARTIANHVWRSDCKQCSTSCATRAMASRDRRLVTTQEAVTSASAAGWIEAKAGVLTRGPVEP